MIFLEFFLVFLIGTVTKRMIVTVLGSIDFISNVTVTGSVHHESSAITGKTIIKNAEIKGTDLYGDIQIKANYQFNSDLVIHGNFNHGKVDLAMIGDNPVFTVMNDFKVGYDSQVSINAGIIEIGGDLLTQVIEYYIQMMV